MPLRHCEVWVSLKLGLIYVDNGCFIQKWKWALQICSLQWSHSLLRACVSVIHWWTRFSQSFLDEIAPYYKNRSNDISEIHSTQVFLGIKRNMWPWIVFLLGWQVFCSPNMCRSLRGKMSLHNLHPLYVYTHSDKQPGITKLTWVPAGNRSSCFESGKGFAEFG